MSRGLICLEGGDHASLCVTLMQPSPPNCAREDIYCTCKGIRGKKIHKGEGGGRGNKDIEREKWGMIYEGVGTGWMRNNEVNRKRGQVSDMDRQVSRQGPIEMDRYIYRNIHK